MLNRIKNNRIGFIVANLGIDIDEFRSSNKVENYKSDMGDVKILCDSYGYIFDIRGEDYCGLWLEENEKYGHLSLFIF